MQRNLKKYTISRSLTKQAPTRRAGAAVEAFTATVQDALKKGNSIGLIGFGTFEVRTRSARDGRNPQTGETIKIPKKNVPAFKAGKKLRDAVS